MDRALARIFGGLAVSFAVYIGWVLAIALFQLIFQNTIRPMMQQLINASRDTWNPIPTPWALLAVGFVIGFFFVRDVRRAAHATIIDPGAMIAIWPPTQRAPFQNPSTVVRFDEKGPRTDETIAVGRRSSVAPRNSAALIREWQKSLAVVVYAAAIWTVLTRV